MEITCDDTRDVSIKIIEKLIELGYIEDNPIWNFEIQDTIQEEINDILGLDIDEQFSINITNKVSCKTPQIKTECIIILQQMMLSI